MENTPREAVTWIKTVEEESIVYFQQIKFTFYFFKEINDKLI